ncbi:hypothetical protein [Pseudarthrobacter sp. Y6]|uniref:hypothetical protein n=1 Tax=Pseudarthrobacter sp. Y6 TaxID=3418422 RepID=UPI003CF516CE
MTPGEDDQADRDRARADSQQDRRQSRWATVLAVGQRLLNAAVTVPVGWAVFYFLLTRLARGPEQLCVFLPAWLIPAYALLPARTGFSPWRQP